MLCGLLGKIFFQGRSTGGRDDQLVGDLLFFQLQGILPGPELGKFFPGQSHSRIQGSIRLFREDQQEIYFLVDHGDLGPDGVFRQLQLVESLAVGFAEKHMDAGGGQLIHAFRRKFTPRQQRIDIPAELLLFFFQSGLSGQEFLSLLEHFFAGEGLSVLRIRLDPGKDIVCLGNGLKFLFGHMDPIRIHLGLMVDMHDSEFTELFKSGGPFRFHAQQRDLFHFCDHATVS